jgi:hypothetical protein
MLRLYDKLARQCAIEQVDSPRFLLDRLASEHRIRQA